MAERKAADLLRCGAAVVVVAPAVSPGLESLAKKGRIKILKRAYRKSDIKNAFLIIAASNSAEVNARVSGDARGMLVNAVDAPELCSFIVPSKVRRGPLVIAVSTSGASPAMARSIRKELEALYPPKLGRHLETLERERRRAIAEIPDAAERRKLLKSLGSEAVLKRLRKK